MNPRLSDRPALLGGSPAVDIPAPHFRWPPVSAVEERAVLETLRAGVLSYPRSQGAVEQLEREFRAQMGMRYSLTTHSGTGALHAAYFALDLPPGSEVLVPAYTHIGTALPLLHLGLVPALCDVDPSVGNVTAGSLEERCTERTRAVAVTHQFGLSCDMVPIVEFARRRGLRIVEDCSHAHGSRYRDLPVGRFGDIACFSLQAHKTISAGEGGILLTDDPSLAERAALLGHFREPREFTSAGKRELVETGFGLKSRLHPLGAALALAGLHSLDAVCRARRTNYQALEAACAGIPGLQALPTPSDCDRGGYFRFVLRFEPRSFAGLSGEQICTALQAEGAVEARAGSLARPLHTYRMFQDPAPSIYPTPWSAGADPLQSRRTFRPGDFPHAEEFSACTLQLPAFTAPAAELIGQYAAALRSVQRGSAALAAHFARAASPS
jgi:perosamine synthetase